MTQTNRSVAVRSPGIGDILRLARIYWRGMTIVTALCMLFVLVWTLQEPKLYSTTVRGLVVATGDNGLGSRHAGAELAVRKANAYQYLAESRPVAERVVEDLNLDLQPEQLLGNITVEVPPESTEIQITGHSNTAEEAKTFADAWMTALVQEVLEMENAGQTPSQELEGIYVKPLNAATLPQQPASPNIRLRMLTGFLLGVAAAVIYALIRNKLDNRSITQNV